MAVEQVTCGGVTVDALSGLEALGPEKPRPTYAVQLSTEEAEKLIEMLKCGVDRLEAGAVPGAAKVRMNLIFDDQKRGLRFFVPGVE